MIAGMYEVYTGSRPGKPRALLALTAALLAGTLALAYWQAETRYALGTREQMDESLSIKIPRGWAQVEPGTFVPQEAAREIGVEYSRRLRVEHYPISRFRSPRELAAQRGWQPKPGFPPRAAPVGPLEGWEVLSRELVARPRIYYEYARRIACTEGGHVIIVEYRTWPNTGLNSLDYQLFDRVARSLELRGRSASSASELLKAAGLSVALDEDLRVSASQLAGAPGVYIGRPGVMDDAWSVSIFRTWLGPGRTPEAIALDAARERWGSSGGSSQREPAADGRMIVAVCEARSSGERDALPELWVVADGPTEAAVLELYTPGDPRCGVRAARAIAHSLEFIEREPTPELDAALQRGIALATDLSADVRRRWGRGEWHWLLRGMVDALDFAQFWRVEPDGVAGGYRGRAVTLRERSRPQSVVEWVLQPDGRSYELRMDAGARRIVERRSGAGVVRQAAVGEEVYESSFEPGPSYVCPPLEWLAQAAVAHAQEGDTIVEMSALDGGRSHYVLLRPLPVQEPGRRRVLQIRDYAPRGRLVEYDSNYEPVALECPGGVASRAQQRWRGGPELRELLRF